MTDDDLLRRLEAQLGPEAGREPPPERVAALRADVEERRRALARPAPGTGRRGFLAAGLAASLGAAAGVVGHEVVDDEAPAPPTEPIVLTGAPEGVAASAELIDHSWGVELLLTISGLAAGRPYAVRYLAADGREVPAGSFLGVEEQLLCRMTAALLRDDTEAIELLDADGGVVLRSRLTRR